MTTTNLLADRNPMPARTTDTIIERYRDPVENNPSATLETSDTYITFLTQVEKPFPPFFRLCPLVCARFRRLPE